MTRIALLLGDAAQREQLSAALASAFGENVRIIDDILQAKDELVVAVVAVGDIAGLLAFGCADFVTLPCDSAEVVRVVAALLDGNDAPPASRGPSSEYRVPVQSEEVTLHLSDGANKVGTLFWPSEVEFRKSLESGDAFFPVSVDGKIQIVARAAVEAFGIPQARESVAWEPEVLAKRVRARLRMQSGATFEGEFVYSAAEARARVADYLNEKDRYFPFRVGNELLAVSKAHVAWVEELR